MKTIFSNLLIRYKGNEKNPFWYAFHSINLIVATFYAYLAIQLRISANFYNLLSVFISIIVAMCLVYFYESQLIVLFAIVYFISIDAHDIADGEIARKFGPTAVGKYIDIISQSVHNDIAYVTFFFFLYRQISQIEYSILFLILFVIIYQFRLKTIFLALLQEDMVLIKQITNTNKSSAFKKGKVFLEFLVLQMRRLRYYSIQIMFLSIFSFSFLGANVFFMMMIILLAIAVYLKIYLPIVSIIKTKFL